MKQNNIIELHLNRYPTVEAVSLYREMLKSKVKSKKSRKKNLATGNKS